ncbi:hypothetical protein SAMN05660236_4488 [Ohtaekwangia koreensis]|uniref:Uncharacterized protein n=1 Tax=Ohtaekwangia koreensis TaxID=688867 RepID=A0A1T5M614_9BACT|nr:hypothetical protein SAMN05660236_4488 [Ohtaekwangia koreensis]
MEAVPLYFDSMDKGTRRDDKTCQQGPGNHGFKKIQDSGPEKSPWFAILITLTDRKYSYIRKNKKVRNIP